MKSKSKNKAIKGRRNRCHAFGPIFQYPQYDEVTQKAMLKALEEVKDGWEYLLIPDSIKVIIPNQYVKPRFLK